MNMPINCGNAKAIVDRTYRLLIFCFCSCLVWSANTMSAAKSETTTIEVTTHIRLGQGATEVAFEFSEPIDTLYFTHRDMRIRQLGWKIGSEGLTLSDGKALSRTPVTAMKLTIVPENRFLDRVNPGAYDFGYGIVLNIMYLRVESDRYHQIILVDAPGSVVASSLGRAAVYSDQSVDITSAYGFFYLGDPHGITGNENLVFSPRILRCPTHNQ